MRKCKHHAAYNFDRTRKYCVRCGIPMGPPERRRKHGSQARREKPIR